MIIIGVVEEQDQTQNARASTLMDVGSLVTVSVYTNLSEKRNYAVPFGYSKHPRVRTLIL